MNKAIIVNPCYLRGDFLTNISNEINFEHIDIVVQKAIKYKDKKEYNYVFVIENNVSEEKIKNIKAGLEQFKTRYKFNKVEDAIEIIDIDENEVDKIQRM